MFADDCCLVKAATKRRISAFAVYFALSALLLVKGFSLRHHLIGVGGDVESFAWMLYWWPWAIGHGINPFVTDLAWNGLGYNLTWATALPTFGLLLAPLTWLGGAVLTTNLVIVLAPACAAFAAFLLLQSVTGRWVPAFLGGLVFGFSPYEMGQSLGHLNLTSIALVPVCLLLCKAYLDRTITNPRFIAALSMIALLQLGISTEVLFTSAVMGIVTWCVFVATAPCKARHLYFLLARDVVLAGIVTIILASPFLFYLVKGMKVVPGQLNDPDVYSADILNFLVPTPVTLPCGALFSSISDQFTGNISEQDAYIGLPFFLLAVYFSTIAFRSSLLVKRCVLVFWISVLFSLGGVLHAGKNVAHVPLPWHLVDRLPVVSSVLPVRFAMFTSLALAVLCAVCLAQRPTVGRYGVVLCGLLFLFPAPAAQGWEATTFSPFFTEGSIKRHFGNDPVLVVLPFGYLGHSMAWQLQSGYAFRQTGGYLGYTPTSEHNDAVLSAFLNNAIPPHFDEQLGFYCVDHHATAIVIGPRTKDILRQAILETHWPAERDGDMIIVRVPPRETLPLFHISGDYWPSPAEVNWMGQQIVVETGVVPARLEIGRPYAVSSPGVSVSTGNIVRHIGFQPGEKTVIDLPANSRTIIRADKVFVPAKEGINTDQRALSLLIGRR
ncbi:hypothetical protein AD931_12055 [Gluconobacter oxydans]|uniref:DUF6311 domain-containing protein n=2 Tax=Gluconobacter oxydans TaxID=442 RepID=A0AB34XKD6_GLUOY|nr:hypothetical protein [Gluconobacter oxydans]AHK71607.1 hypothetical protein GLS_c17300 [Gluconobacter oxydans DSM 3504]KXV07341.1 hypothetical protein AD931_12055 [Gluconobacter oxydans]